MRFSLYTTFLEPSAPQGGKQVAIYEGVADPQEMQALARSSGAPLSVFVTGNTGFAIELRIFTPGKEKGESDSAALAALHHLMSRCEVAEEVMVRMAKDTLEARFDGQWWLEQGNPKVELKRGSDLSMVYAGFGLEAGPLRQIVNTHLPLGVVRAARPKVVVPLSRLRSLEALEPDYGALGRVCSASGSSGVIALAMEGDRLGMRYFMVSEGKEDHAGANTAACAAAYLCAFERSRKLHPVIERRTSFTLEQGRALGLPSRLRVERREGKFWVSGLVQEVCTG